MQTVIGIKRNTSLILNVMIYDYSEIYIEFKAREEFTWFSTSNLYYVYRII